MSDEYMAISIYFGHKVNLTLIVGKEEVDSILEKIKNKETFMVEFDHKQVLINGEFVQFVTVYKNSHGFRMCQVREL